MKTTSGWKVEIPERLSPTGKRQRAFFSTRDEAKLYAAQLREDHEEQGTEVCTIKPSLADEAVRAVAWLEPYGVSLIEAACMVVDAKKTELASSSIEDALRAFLVNKVRSEPISRKGVCPDAAQFIEIIHSHPTGSVIRGQKRAGVEF